MALPLGREIAWLIAVVQVVAENAADPNYKVTDKLIPYNA